MLIDKKYLFIFLVLAIIVSLSVVSATNFNDDNGLKVNVLKDIASGNDNLEIAGHVSAYFRIDGWGKENVHVKIIDKDDGDVLVDDYTSDRGEVSWWGVPFVSYNCRAYVYYNDMVYVKDFYVSSTSDSVEVEINTADPIKLKVTPEKQVVKTGESIKINGILKNGDEPISNALINLTNDDGQQVVKTDANGRFSYTFTGKDQGLYYNTFSYQAPYGSIVTKCHVTVKNEYEINVDDVSVKVGEPASIRGTLLSNGQPLSNGTVNLVINNHYESVQTDANGHFIYTFTPEKACDMNVTFYYMTGHGAYYVYDVCHVNVKDNYKINLNVDNINMTRGEVSISGTLLNNSKTLPDATIRGYVSGVEGVKTLKTDANGQFTCTFSLKEIGSYNAVFAYILPDHSYIEKVCHINVNGDKYQILDMSNNLNTTLTNKTSL